MNNNYVKLRMKIKNIKISKNNELAQNSYINGCGKSIYIISSE